MKTQRYLTLLTITTLMFLLISSVQDTEANFIVQIVYFVPKDRTPDPDMGTKMDNLIKEIKQFFADEMDSHGFGNKTFEFETDENGDAMVHQVIGEHNIAAYENLEQAGSQEINDQFDTSTGNILLMVLDYFGSVTCGRGGKYGGGPEAGGFVIVPASGDCFSFQTIAHELGHAFGLYHDFRSSEYMMSYGANRNKLSYCAAEFLDVSPYFNSGSGEFNSTHPSIQMLTPSFVSLPVTIRLSFELTDTAGLHQVQLIIPEDDLSVVDCKSLNGESATVEFITDQLHDTDKVALLVADDLGDYSWKSFTIDITDLIPTPDAISIPDANLAAAIRDELDLASDSQITALDMLGLVSILSERNQIKDLTGLEHATNIAGIYLSHNQISDLTPLAGLKQLGRLHLRENKIEDVTPLAGLTKLTWLNLGDNQISDVAPLAGLTELTHLQLWNNQINDVSSLTGLTNLVELHLRGNPMRNREPLLTIQSKNPNANIYIDPVVENRAPVFTESPNATRLVVENAAVGTNIGSPISATDADNDALTYTLGGTDKDAFEIDSTNGQLKTKVGIQLDYETKPSYTVTVTATDPGGLTDTIMVTINLQDIDESVETKTISIPDENLAATIREDLDLAPDSQITVLDMLGLVTLLSDRKQIKDLTGLEHATNLRRIFLSHNQISDLTSLAGLKQLQELQLRENEIEDVAPLAGLTKLTWLNLGDNQISDVAPLAGLTELTHLQLWNNRINDVNSLTGLTNLVELNLRRNPMRNREPLLTIQSKNPNANIYIDPVVPNRAPVFTESPNVTRLVVENAAVGTSIGSPISATDADNDALTYTLGGTDKDSFDIDSTNGQLITKVGVEFDFDTKAFYVVTVTATDTEGLTATISVKIDIEDIDEPIAAETISIPDENLAAAIRETLSLETEAVITQLDIQQLKSLSATNQEITDLTGLEFAINLQNLVLTDNQISDIRPLSELTQLVELSLQNNQISDVTPLAELINLERLVLVGNPITNREPLLTLLRNNPAIKIFLKNDREPLPVTLSYFRAELTDAGVILKWTTESEVDNAGFNILRSNRRNGKFKVVNPKLIEGAGTTGERQKYTWTDTTAKPDTIYYYRIEDVSHAGVRQQLATVRIRGFVLARDKFATSWASLKTQN